MGLFSGIRKAGEAVNSAFTGTVKKESVRSGLGASDSDATNRAIQMGRDLVSGLNPAIGVIDDAVSMGQNFNSAVNSDNITDRGINVTKGIQSTLAASAPILGKAGMVGAAGIVAPVAATMAPAIMIAGPAAKRMQDDTIRSEDIDAYRKSQEFFGR